MQGKVLKVEVGGCVKHVWESRSGNGLGKHSPGAGQHEGPAGGS